MTSSRSISHRAARTLAVFAASALAIASQPGASAQPQPEQEVEEFPPWLLETPTISPSLATHVFPTPVLRVRIHAIATADDDGSNMDPQLTAKNVAISIAAAAVYFEPAGIDLQFDPAKDFEIRKSNLLNRDCTLAANARSLPATVMPTCDKTLHSAERKRVAELYPTKSVLIFRHLQGFCYSSGPTAKSCPAKTVGWTLSKATGGYSSSGSPFSVVGPQSGGGAYLAHELGHQFDLRHTFGIVPAPANPADTDPAHLFRAYADVIRHYVEVEHHSVENGLHVFDNDAPTVIDTPPDARGGLFTARHLDACGDTATIDIPVTFANGTTFTYKYAPDRHNIMSYFSCGPYEHFSFSQIDQMRAALMTGNKKAVLQ